MNPSIPHGGNTEAIRARLELGAAPLVDFSASVNPLGPSRRVLDAAKEAVDRSGSYPEVGNPRLVERLAEYHGVPEDRIVVGAGTTEIISLVGRSLREVLALHAQEQGNPRMTLSHVVEPTYGEYRRVSALNDLRVEAWSKPLIGWRQEFLPRSASGIYWTGHPNNPTGRAWDRDRLLDLVDDTGHLLVVVDEAFLPFFPDEEDRTLAGSVVDRKNLLVLRSLTKIHAIPGLRVGYAVTSADMALRLRQFQDPWTVSAPAEAAALAALDDDEARDWAVLLVSAETRRMIDRLWKIPGLRPAWPSADRPEDAPPCPNFVLVSLVETSWDSPSFRDALARRGHLVRECSDFAGLEVGSRVTGPDLVLETRGHIRIGVRTKLENDALLLAIEELMAEGMRS